jgi:hypothetical protein
MSRDHAFDAPALRERLAAVGSRLASRESAEAEALAAARERAERLHALVAEGLSGYHGAVRAAGAPQLAVELSEPRADDKHLRSVQFDLRRGRHVAIVTVKSKGEVTLVGPFRSGKNEGPCLSFPFGAEAELEKALPEFLERFLEEAATP